MLALNQKNEWKREGRRLIRRGEGVWLPAKARCCKVGVAEDVSGARGYLTWKLSCGHPCFSYWPWRRPRLPPTSNKSVGSKYFFRSRTTHQGKKEVQAASQSTRTPPGIVTPSCSICLLIFWSYVMHAILRR